MTIKQQLEAIHAADDYSGGWYPVSISLTGTASFNSGWATHFSGQFTIRG